MAVIGGYEHLLFIEGVHRACSLVLFFLLNFFDFYVIFFFCPFPPPFHYSELIISVAATTTTPANLHLYRPPELPPSLTDVSHAPYPFAPSSPFHS